MSVAAASSSAASAAANEIRVALQGLRESIQVIAKKSNAKRQPLLVAVSKTKPVEAILHAYNASVQPPQRHFGENYVQELVEKAADASLNQDVSNDQHIKWHFIGHLQSNKCKQIAKIPNLVLVESVDSVKLATELNKACDSVGRSTRLPVLIQVNTSGEESKFGCEPREALALYSHVLKSCPKLQAKGLMTIGRLADTPQPDCFDTLVSIRAEILKEFAGKAESEVNEESFEMSMGMSGDYEMAIEKGATIVRIGSTIFGARDYSKKDAPSAATADSK